MANNTYQKITDRILEQLDKGVIPWKKPWQTSGIWARSHVTGKEYSLLNQMLIDDSGEYITFNQAKKEGGFVKKGAKGKTVTFWKMLVYKQEESEETDKKEKAKKIPFLKTYTVFKIEDCDGITEKFPTPPLPDVAERIETAENIWREYCEREGIPVYEKESARAFYSPTDDSVTIPTIQQFYGTEDYYSTLFHELVHSTLLRLGRPKPKSFGDKTYAEEELTAEMGAAFLVARFGLNTEKQTEQNAAYIDSWRKKISEDKNLVVVAAQRAEKAVNLILNIKKEENDENED